MRKRIKRLFKRLLKVGGIAFLALVIFGVGIAIGQESAGGHYTVVVRDDTSIRFEDEPVIIVEERVKQQVLEQVEDQVVNLPIPTVPPVPTVPPIPEIPELPEMPRTVYIERSPSFFDVVNGVGTVLASLGLIGLGVLMIVRGRRELKEKTPESLNK